MFCQKEECAICVAPSFFFGRENGEVMDEDLPEDFREERRRLQVGLSLNILFYNNQTLKSVDAYPRRFSALRSEHSLCSRRFARGF